MPDVPGRSSLRPARIAGCVAIAVATLVGVPVLLGAAPGDSLSRPSVGAQGKLLPDLDAATPQRFAAVVVGSGKTRRVLLGFASAAENVGAGPLIVQGYRENLGQPTLVADQVVQLANGNTTIVPGVGHFEYVTDPTHEHFHLLPFMRYELRSASSFKLVVTDRKTGFCLGDRYNADPKKTLPGEPPGRVYNTNCGPGTPDLLSLVEGISVGWGDNYEAWRDGQYIELTGLDAGRYVLVHRVNPGRRLEESSYTNNASSVLLRLTWPDGKSGRPALKVLRRCPETARCPAPA
jgi:hypothetical protein